jgi:ABC-type Fe3+ transport system substrate-binding protein
MFIRGRGTSMRTKILIALLCAVAGGCGDTPERALDQAAEDDPLVQKYGRPLQSLPEVELVLISPHNTDIQGEYEAAYIQHHALTFGERVNFEWRDVGGGSSSILSHLRNVYENGDTARIDVVWGGGDFNFTRMAAEGILQPMQLPPDVMENIPATFGGLTMCDPERLWCGSAVSGFGIFYNRQLLERIRLPLPTRWEDLGAPHFFDLVGLADPAQSGSAAASYEMIVQSEATWPAGWAKLLSILGNAKRFYAGAGDAAEALPSGEAAVTTCIDFYGTNRMAKYPESLVYLSPKGQTSFNPDPIAILKNPPNPELAQHFVRFVLSPEGQALWALPVGHPSGPKTKALGRQPIRKDFYEQHAGEMLASIVNPYESGQTMEVDTELWNDSYGLLRHLVWAAAVRNVDFLKAAKQKLIETDFPESRLRLFNRLPANVATREALAATNALLADRKQRDIVVTDWVSFFRDQYRQVARDAVPQERADVAREPGALAP